MRIKEDFRMLRELQGLSQKDVAKLAGISCTTLQSFEYGERDVGYTKVMRLFNCIGFTLVFEPIDEPLTYNERLERTRHIRKKRGRNGK